MSSRRQSNDHKLSPASSSTAEMMSKNVDELACLPRHPGTFRATDVPDSFRGKFRNLTNTALVEVVREEPCRGENDSKTRSVYRFTEWADQKLQSFLENRDTTCPCGHSGILNRGDYYECGFEPCDQEFAREELEVSG